MRLQAVETTLLPCWLPPLDDSSSSIVSSLWLNGDNSVVVPHLEGSIARKKQIENQLLYFLKVSKT